MCNRLLVLSVLLLGCSGTKSPDSAQDAALDGQVDSDSGPIDGGETAAVFGQRCAPEEMAGFVEVRQNEGSNTARYVHAELYSSISPRLTVPKLQDAACRYHEETATAPCPPCDSGEICGLDGACSPEPRLDPQASLVLRSGEMEQVINADPDFGQLQGEVQLAGSALSMELSGWSQVVTLSELAVPAELEGLMVDLSGSLDTPERLDIRWNDPSLDTHVATLIPINHHAGGQTFTQCTVASSQASFAVEQPMLTPLAVSTGLEFQGVFHARFAAAETPIGCVEFRFLLHQFALP